jgi:1,2-diacylglycerol 3-alpha-glucosyltransferase
MIAVLFHRIGPYHQVRLRATSAFMPLCAIQGCCFDRTYAWSEIKGDFGFPVETVFKDDDSDEQPNHVVKECMADMLDQMRPDAVVVPGWSRNLALAALCWALDHQIPAVVMSDSTARDERRWWWKENIKRQLVGCFSSGLVAGQPQKEYLIKLGMAPDRISKGYDVVDNEYFARGAKEARSQESEVRRKFQLPERYFLVPARFTWEKNLPRFIRAYARYRELSVQHEPWNLVLLGDGPLLSSILKLRSSFGLDACIHLPGFKQYPELPAYYGLATAVILPSISETWGLVVNEAMASGLPVLVSNRCGCARDLVKEGVNGFTFNPYNVEGIAQSMLQLSAFPPLKLLEMGAASSRIIADWGPERFAQGLKQAVDKALEVGPVKAGWMQRVVLKALTCR